MNQSEVRQTFDYDAETGDLIRKSNNKRTGTIDYTGYKRTKYKNKTTLCHRLVYVWHHGDIPDHFHVDHIDHNRANNRIENLQAITPYENFIKKKPNSNKRRMSVDQYHTEVLERLLSLYRELPLEHCVRVIDTIEGIEDLYYNKCKKVVNSGSNRPVVKPPKSETYERPI
jgi:hypothetical protein